MILKMDTGVPACEKKNLMKLRIQQDITNTRFSVNWVNNAHGQMSLTSTNQSISITISRPPLPTKTYGNISANICVFSIDASNIFSQRTHSYCLRNILSNRILTGEWRNVTFRVAGDRQLQFQSRNQTPSNI